MKAYNSINSNKLSDDVVLADRLLKRMIGLLGKRKLEGESLWILPCMGVHTFGMRFPIDVVFLDRHNRIIALKKNLPPNRLTPLYPGAKSALELPSGIIDSTNTTVGDMIEFV